MSTTALIITIVAGYFLVGLIAAFLVEVFGPEPLDIDEFGLVALLWVLFAPGALIHKAVSKLYGLAQRARRKRNTRIDMDYLDRMEEDVK